ncbi:hypothetical protein V5799_005636 [Amblyomma americanum]|uniref:THAP-type domain-containing protein n=1 Tax=Amblyomma americanum TaxID=6943 RepID=A0AAQ4DYP4_AMBAM
MLRRSTGLSLVVLLVACVHVDTKMPNKCCVPGCTGNYDTGRKIQVFSFPKVDDTFKKWLRAIPRKDFVPTSYTKVCAHHFDASCIKTTTSYTDPSKNRKCAYSSIASTAVAPWIGAYCIPSNLERQSCEARTAGF